MFHYMYYAIFIFWGIILIVYGILALFWKKIQKKLESEIIQNDIDNVDDRNDEISSIDKNNKP